MNNAFTFLSESPYFAHVKMINHRKFYFFQNSGMICVPEIEFDVVYFGYGKCKFIEDTPKWFQNLFFQADALYDEKNRLYQLFHKKIPMVASPSLRLEECAISKKSLLQLSGDFSYDDTIEEIKIKLENYTIYFLNDQEKRELKPVLWGENKIGLNPMVCSKFISDNHYIDIKISKH
jgi:hypothetical protein